MRCFFALQLDAKTKLAIQAWLEKSLPSFEYPVPASNYHITLAFLGQLENRQLDQIVRTIEQHKVDSGSSVRERLQNASAETSMSLTLDFMGYWSKPKALWLGTNNPPASLLNLSSILHSDARETGINIQQHNYVPHLTLVRKCRENPPGALIEPNFVCQFEHFHLCESVSGKHGVSYPSRYSWPIRQLVALNSS